MVNKKNMFKKQSTKNTVPDTSTYSQNVAVSAEYRMYHLTEAEPITNWIHYKGGANNGVSFSLLAKNPEGNNNVLSGSIKIECINGQDETREYAICDIIKNTSDLSTSFYFTSAHLGKCGIECNLQKNCCFRLKLEPNTGDDVWIEVVMNY